ncbi:MAG: sensor histidine kinase, partial [Stackebrandtia sp.]
MTAGTGSRVRRTISVLIDTGPPGDPAWRLRPSLILALAGPGSVPFALILFAIQNQVLHSLYAIGWAAVPLSLSNAAAIVLARFRPVGAWLLLLLSFASTAVVTPVRSGESWPWTVAGLFALLVVQYAVARDCRITTTAICWSSCFVIGLYAGARVGGETAWQNLTMESLLTVAVAALGVSVRAVRRARRRVAEQERATAAERSRRGLLEDRARIARELHDVVAHHMSVISVQASTAEYRLRELPAEARSEFRSIGDQARESLAEMRRLLAVLRNEDDAASTAPQPD